MPTLQEPGPAHRGDSLVSQSDNKSPSAVARKKEFFFSYDRSRNVYENKRNMDKMAHEEAYNNAQLRPILDRVLRLERRNPDGSLGRERCFSTCFYPMPSRWSILLSP